MVHRTFVAFASSDRVLSGLIESACALCSQSATEFNPWNRNDVSGQPIDRSVFSWVEGADAFVADISEPNHNVTYEIGLALRLAKPIRLLRATSKQRKTLEEIGLFHNTGHDDYSTAPDLIGPRAAPLFSSAVWVRQLIESHSERNKEGSKNAFS